MRPYLLLALGVLLIGSPAEARQAQGDVAPTPVLTAEARIALEAFRAEMAAVRAAHDAAGPTDSIAAELARRVEIDHAARRAYGALMQGDAATRGAVDLVGADIIAIDAENTAYLKSALPEDGWFRNSRDGEQTTTNAWLIVQHSPDRAFMREVLTRMEPLAAAGEVSGRDYALLYDRVEMFEGRPQRFASQVVCTNGVRSFHAIEDASLVDMRRREIGHPESFADTAVRLRVGQPCG